MRGPRGSIGAAVLALSCTTPDSAAPVEHATTSSDTAASTSDPPHAESTTGSLDSGETGGTSTTLGPGAGDESTGSVPGAGRPFDYLRREPYSRLVLEVDAVGGLALSPSTASQIIDVLEALVDKPDGIEIVVDDVLIPGGADHAWTADERIALGLERFDLDVPEGTIAIHVMLLDGHAAEDDTQDGVTLGHAWANTHLVLYEQQIGAGCQGVLVGDLAQVLCERTESLILQHELGHVLGLVDFGISMQRDHRDPDPRHGPHDADPGCLMYWRYDGLDLVDAVVDELVMGAPSVQFDPACLQDLAAAQR